MDLKGSLAGSKALRSDPCPQIVRLYAKASEPRMEQEVTESANYNGFP
jgi:hypothetical protein